MLTPATRVRLLAGTSVLMLATLTACSDDAVSVDDLEEQVSGMFTSEVGWTPASVDCPDELDAEVDATTRCVASDEDGNELGVTVTVTGVEGDRVDLDIQADDELMTDAGDDPAGDEPAAGTGTEPPAGSDPAAADPQVGGDTGAAGDGTMILQSYVESQAMSALEESVGQRPASIDCPGDMAAVQGTTMRCTLTADDSTQYGMTAEVTSVDGGNFNLNFQVDDAPMG